MRYLRAAALAVPLLLVAQASWAAEKYTWDGLGTGDGKCGIYSLHLEFVVDNGRATGFWQQKGRTVRNFDFPIKPDGRFAGEVTVGNGGIMHAKGQLGAAPTIDLSGYCGFGGPLKKE
jgi:hypothetical protein